MSDGNATGKNKRSGFHGRLQRQVHAAAGRRNDGTAGAWDGKSVGEVSGQT